MITSWWANKALVPQLIHGVRCAYSNLSTPMVRTLVSIPENIASVLDHIPKKNHLSRNDVIRTVIEDWLKAQNKPGTQAFGILKEANSIDGVKLQRKLRNEW